MTLHANTWIKACLLSAEVVACMHSFWRLCLSPNGRGGVSGDAGPVLRAGRQQDHSDESRQQLQLLINVGAHGPTLQRTRERIC